MNPFAETHPTSDGYMAANSLIQFAARLLHQGARPFLFGRSVRGRRDYYFVDVVLGRRQRLDYLSTRVNMLACTTLRVYMLMHPEEYERASNIFLAARVPDEEFPATGIVTNNAFLPVSVVVAPGGGWIEICDTQITRPRNMFAAIILGTTYGIRDNYLYGNARGIYAMYNAAEDSTSNEGDFSFVRRTSAQINSISLSGEKGIILFIYLYLYIYFTYK